MASSTSASAGRRAGSVGLGNRGHPIAAVERTRPCPETRGTKVIHTGALGNGCKTGRSLDRVTDLQWTAAFESFQPTREAGVALPGTAMASQIMARGYGVEDAKRR